MREFSTPRERNAYELGLADAANNRAEPLTLAKVKAMSTEEVAARLPEVNDVLQHGDPKEPDDA